MTEALNIQSPLKLNGDCLVDLKPESDTYESIVVFVHGQPGSKDSWCAVISRLLGSNQRLVAYDRPGWGVNNQDATSIDGNAQYLASILETFPKDKSVVLVGHSLGAAISIVTATMASDRVRKVVAIAPAFNGDAVVRLDSMIALPYIGVGLSKLTLEVYKRKMGFSHWGGSSTRSFHLEQSWLLKELHGLDNAITRFDGELSVLYARDDVVVPMRSIVTTLRSSPSSRVDVLKNGGHDLIRTRASSVAYFLATLL